MRWGRNTIFGIGILFLLVLSFAALADPEGVRRNIGLARVASWSPNYDVQENGYNFTYRYLIRYYNNGSNLTEPMFNVTINFTEQLSGLGVNSSLIVDNKSVRVYEVNEWGVCINESANGAANGTCVSIPWSQA